VQNGRDRNSYIDHLPTRTAWHCSANQTSRRICRSDFGIMGFQRRSFRREGEKGGGGERERERERENRAFLVVECASLARGEFPAPFRSFQSVTFISGDFPYLSLSRLKLRSSPPCDGSIVDVRIHATALRATGLAGLL